MYPNVNFDTYIYSTNFFLIKYIVHFSVSCSCAGSARYRIPYVTIVVKFSGYCQLDLQSTTKSIISSNRNVIL